MNPSISTPLRAAPAPHRGIVRRIADTLALWSARSQRRFEIGLLDAHLLKDVGLTREQLEAERDKPFWRA